MAYAENTNVPIEKTMGEIVALVKKAGAARIAQIEEPDAMAVQFFLHERMVRFRVTLPEVNYAQRAGARPATDKEKRASQEQRHRQRARALMLVIKAKLESVESEVETFDEAFLPNIVMADGATLYERVSERLRLEYAGGKPLPMLLQGPTA